MDILRMDGSAAVRLIGAYIGATLGMAAVAFTVALALGLAYGAVMLVLRYAYGIELPNPANLFR